MINRKVKKEIENYFAVNVVSITNKKIEIIPNDSDTRHLNKKALIEAVSIYSDGRKVVMQ